MGILAEAVQKGNDPVGELIDDVLMALEGVRSSYRMALIPERFPCYVVVLDGDVRFCYDWEVCRIHVHGVPAKFKKVKNTEELAAFLALYIQPEAATQQEASDDTPPWE